MDLRHPVKSVQRAWQDAIEKDLAGLNSDVADAVLGASAEGPVLRRPMARECSVAMFTQVWRAADLGMDRGPRANEDVDAETVVVTGPAGDACVYAGGRRLYHLARPNRRFFLDVAAQPLRGPGHAAAYNGRDSADLEAFDFEVAVGTAEVLRTSRRRQRARVHRPVLAQLSGGAEGRRAGERSAASQSRSMNATILRRLRLSAEQGAGTGLVSRGTVLAVTEIDRDRGAATLMVLEVGDGVVGPVVGFEFGHGLVHDAPGGRAASAQRS